MSGGILHDKFKEVKKQLCGTIRGKENVIDLILTALFADGNILMEDVPGVGKTTLAKALAHSINAEFSRIQFTPDLLPADIIGSPIYNPKDGTFSFRNGPVFTNILLADEINRASPRTQSALLEAMSEKHVSIEGKTQPLPSPFLVIATQNPIEYYGTYPLPEAQLDRFALKLSLGYPDEESERQLVNERRHSDPLENVKPVLSAQEIISIQAEVRETGLEKSVSDYILAIVRSTRTDSRVKLGASPRAALMYFRCAQALAWLSGREYVKPDDVKALAVPLLAHRIILSVDCRHSGMTNEEVIADILGQTVVPV